MEQTTNCSFCDCELSQYADKCPVCGYSTEKEYYYLETSNKTIAELFEQDRRRRSYYLCPDCGGSNFEGSQILRRYDKQICCLDCYCTIIVLKPNGKVYSGTKIDWDNYLNKTYIFDDTWDKWKPNYLHKKFLLFTNLIKSILKDLTCQN